MCCRARELSMTSEVTHDTFVASMGGACCDVIKMVSVYTMVKGWRHRLRSHKKDRDTCNQKKSFHYLTNGLLRHRRFLWREGRGETDIVSDHHQHFILSNLLEARTSSSFSGAIRTKEKTYDRQEIIRVSDNKYNNTTNETTYQFLQSIKDVQCSILSFFCLVHVMRWWEFELMTLSISPRIPIPITDSNANSQHLP